ncbi:unnamed protein product [Urochloa humidicola]
MEGIDSAEAAIRVEGKAILQLFRSGDERGALTRADGLANAHKDSPSAVILKADLLREHVDGDKLSVREIDRSELRARVLHDVKAGYLDAVKMVPNCIDMRVSLGEVLSDLGECDRAEAELTRALEMEHPIDPAINILNYGVLRPVRSTARTRIRDVMKRGLDARDRNRKILIDGINLRTEEIMALQDSNVALKRAAQVASMYPFSVRAHLLRAHMCMEFAYSLPDRVCRGALRNGLTALENAEREMKCDFQKSLVVSVFRAKMHYLLHEYVAAEQECRRALLIKDADDPAEQDIPPGSVQGCDKDERTYSCRAQLSWLLVRLATDSISFYLTAFEQHESFTLASLKEHYHGPDSGIVKMLLSVEKRHCSFTAYICPCCKKLNLPTPISLLEHMTKAHAASLPQLERLETLVKALESDASAQDDWPSDDLSVVKSPTEAPRNSFPDILEKKRCEAARICEEIQQALLALPTQCSSIQASSEVRKLWEKLKEVSKLDLLLPFARLSLWREILKQMSADAHDRVVTAADMEQVFNFQNELPVVDIEDHYKYT